MLYYSTVEPSTLELLKKLQSLPFLQNTRLVGGTALALQIGHRQSIDLDLFGEITVESDIIIEELNTIGTLKIIKDFKNIHIFLLNQIKLDIVNYRYPWLNDSVVADGICMASLEDICAMKLAAITGRGTKKDFIDIYFLSEYYNLGQMLSFYSQKYPDGSEFIVLKSLSYFEDANPDPEPYMLKKISWKKIKNAITSWL